MKTSRLAQNLLRFLPVLCILASSGIVIQQWLRHEHLKKELAVTEREYARLEKRFKELKYPNQIHSASDTTVEETHTHEHHDGDGD